MPSPIAHSLTGLALGALFAPTALRRNPAWYACAVVAANAPDVDFAAGLMIGHVNALHGGATHSIGAALLFAALGAAILGSFWRRRSMLFGVLVLLYGSHVFLDLLSGVPGTPNSMAVFWPFSGADVTLPWQPLHPIAHGAPHHGMDGFLGELLSVHNLRAVAREALLFTPLVLAAAWIRAWWSRRPAGSQTSMQGHDTGA